MSSIKLYGKNKIIFTLNKLRAYNGAENIAVTISSQSAVCYRRRASESAATQSRRASPRLNTHATRCSLRDGYWVGERTV